MYKMVWSFIALCGLSLHVAANEIELSISDEIIDLRFAVSYEQDFSGTFALLHADHNDVKTDQVSYTFATRGTIDRVDITLGTRLFLLGVDSDDGFGAALGIGANTNIMGKVFVTGEVFYAPEIITGGDFDSTLDAELRLCYQLIENGLLYIGYRQFEVDSKKSGKQDIYEDPFIGIKFTF
ncbi:YfaZ family protein [Pseudomonadales bacterium]|jgi:hypothetical protein|nr:YfaZ family protein [Pseudomonadales bacterium]MDA8965506.1 YfaZ family protein [Pseudomonadales bacterium]MDB4451291.1 YfaZ family protein [Pseudomonadales bacterium]MDB4493128.1 YfaZ family protein [Pseudomonadales bacterium]